MIVLHQQPALKMKVNGNKIAEKILFDLKKETEFLKKQNFFPKLAIILIGENPISKSYVEQKEIRAEEVGIETIRIDLAEDITEEALSEKVEQLNNDEMISGIIIQRPLPEQINSELATKIISKEKDVDGFREDSRYHPPIAKAVGKILEEVFEEINLPMNFLIWLKSKKIAVIGKGETGGGPIITMLRQWGTEPEVIDTRTENKDKILRESDIVISTVGKEEILNVNLLKKNVILIAVGMFKKNGKFEADFDQKKAEEIASFYSPVPGGVGPVNVAMLLQNVLLAAK